VKRDFLRTIAFAALAWGCRLPQHPSLPADSTQEQTTSCASGDPWTCPSRLAVPCDGWWWQERQIAGAEEPDPWAIARIVYDLVDEIVPSKCLTSCTAETKGWSCEVAQCAFGDVVVDYRREWREETYTSHGHEKTLLVETVTAELHASNASWSRIDLVGARAGFEALDVAASWTGHIDRSVPDDGSFHFEGAQSGSDNNSWVQQTWVATSCDASVRQHTHGDEYKLILTTPDSTLEVEVDDEYGCSPTYATLDGDAYEVEAEGWHIVGPDTDGDGFSVAGGDCDDTDARVNPCGGCEE
jgi:hypothetical protein